MLMLLISFCTVGILRLKETPGLHMPLETDTAYVGSDFPDSVADEIEIPVTVVLSHGVAVLPTATESPLLYACELWVFAMCPALRGSTVSYAGDAHFPKHSLEYSLNFWSQSKKKKVTVVLSPVLSPVHGLLRRYVQGAEIGSLGPVTSIRFKKTFPVRQ